MLFMSFFTALGISNFLIFIVGVLWLMIVESSDNKKLTIS